MKKKFLFMLLTTIYLIQLLALHIMSPFLLFMKGTPPPTTASFFVLITLIVFSLILIIINIVTAFLGLRRSTNTAKKNSLGAIMGFKLALIPFFIGHAFWTLVAVAGFLNPFLMVLAFIIPFFFLFYAFLVLFTTSSYSIVQIIKMKKEGIITPGQCVLHIIMQLLFFADVIDSMYLFFKFRKRF